MKTLSCDNCNTKFNVHDDCLIVRCPGCHCEVEARDGTPPTDASTMRELYRKVGGIMFGVVTFLTLIGAADAQAPRIINGHWTGRKPLPPALLKQLHDRAAARHGNLIARLPKATAAKFDARTLGWVPPIRDQKQCGSCLPKGTMILMSDETERPIEDVRVSDVVVSAEGALARVVGTPRRLVNQLMKVTTEKHSLEATPDHAVRTKGGYVCVKDLHAGEWVAIVNVSADPTWEQVVEVVRGPPESCVVYDLKTDNYRSYVANGIGVHNCWDFSGSGVVTSALIKAGQIPNSANGCSEQYTLDCGSNGGCNGDDNITVLQWAKSTGLPLDSDYGRTYQASAGRCAYTTSMKLWKISDWGFCTSAQQSGVAATDDIKKALVAFGPIGVGIDAGGLGDGTGIISGTGHSIDHDVIIVGWDDTMGWEKTVQTEVPVGSGVYQTQVVRGTGVWIMRNSWGTGWGQTCGGTESGYCYVTYGSYDIGTEACWATATPAVPPTPPNPWVTTSLIDLPTSMPCCGQTTPVTVTYVPPVDTVTVYRDPTNGQLWRMTSATTFEVLPQYVAPRMQAMAGVACAGGR